MSPRTRLLGLLAVACLTPTAPAAARLEIGISDQSPSVFAHKLFTPLHLRYARIVVPWNVARRHDYWPKVLTAWLAGASKAHIQPHVAFSVYSTKRRAIPGLSRYHTAFRAFRLRWPSVRVFTPWNEANVHVEPTYRARMAALYYGVLHRYCPSCTVVAADVLDLSGLDGWLRQFLRYAPGHPRLWGVHNYRDANRNRSLRTSATLRLTRILKGTLWVTESGGIAGLQSARHNTAWTYSPARAGRSLKHLFALIDAPQVRRRYRRVYVYNFFGAWDRRHRTKRWDSGLIGLDGKPRPAYWDFKHIIARLG